jgi:hypothetical protein
MDALVVVGKTINSKLEKRANQFKMSSRSHIKWKNLCLFVLINDEMVAEINLKASRCNVQKCSVVDCYMQLVFFQVFGELDLKVFVLDGFFIAFENLFSTRCIRIAIERVECSHAISIINVCIKRVICLLVQVSSSHSRYSLGN